MVADKDKYITGANGEKRMKGVQLAIPVVTGTVAISLGKKATETATHTWTVYLRSPLNQNLGQIIRKVIFHLHDSFANPNRDVKSPPFELKENGWGEFDILIEIHFHDDVQEPPIELLHHLRLGLDMHGKPQKRPHVFEMYEELVFWEPTAALYDRVTKNSTSAPESSVEQYFGRFDAEADYKLIQAGRKRVAKSMAMLKAKLAAIEAEDGDPSKSLGLM